MDTIAIIIFFIFLGWVVLISWKRYSNELSRTRFKLFLREQELNSLLLENDYQNNFQESFSEN